MKRTAPFLTLASALAVTFAAAQTPAPKAATAQATTTKHALSAKTGTAARTTASTGGVKIPPGIPVYHRLVRTAFALKYQDILVGTGELAEPLKLYKVKYTGWLAADGKKFDSSEDHPGKEPIQFPQGRGRVIPGWDQAFEGMRIGGKRRIFIPYQLAYGVAGRPPVIPAKSDLIFDIELVAVEDMPAPGAMGSGGMGSGMGGRPMPQRPAAPPAPGAAPAPATPGSPASPAAAPKPADPAAMPAPATPSAPPTPPPADKPATPQP
jgi:peptidylprolyl isomerase